MPDVVRRAGCVVGVALVVGTWIGMLDTLVVARGLHQLEEVGLPMERTAEEAWPHFRGRRVNYESVAYAVADFAVAPPGPWSGPREHLPGMAIIPQRPADRRPEDTREHERPRSEGTGW